MKEVKSPRKPFIIYALVVAVVILLLNGLLFPNILEQRTEEVDYGTFMTMTENKEIGLVEVQDTEIVFTDKNQEHVYKTGVMNDPGLVERLHDAGAKFSQNIEEQMPVWMSLLLSYVIPIAIFLFIGNWLSKKMASKMGGPNSMAFGMGKSNAKIYVQSDSGIHFSDVAGEEEAKELLSEIVDFLHNPARYREIGASMPKGALLVGPPGTGKTLLAKAVAGEADVPFFSISGSDFVEMFVGTGASRVRDMFKKAQQTAPCIVFIDEIDAVGRQRGAGMGGGNDEREQTLNQLLVEMDGMGENKGIVIIAATNRPDVLDPALLRSGRFDRQITVNLPDKRGRYEILKVHARNKKLAPNANLEGLAKRTPGFSGADLENVLNEGAILAVRDKRKVITMEDLDEAIDRVMMGPAKKSKKYTDREKRLVAFHEAGHAVIGLKLDDADKVEKVTIIPRGEAGGYNLMTPKEEKMMPTKADFMAQITGLMGGRVAEEVMFDEVSAGASNDIQKATKIAKAMVRSWGMSSLGPIQYDDGTGNVFLGRDYGSGSNYSGEIAYEIDKEIRKIINECYDRAKQIIEDNKDLLTLIAETLIEEETITSEQIYNLMNYGKLISPEDEVRAAEAKAKAAEQKLKDLEAGITQEDTAEEVHEDVQDSKEPDIDFDAALKELTKNDYDEHKE